MDGCFLHVSCAPEKDINDFVLLATLRRTIDQSKNVLLVPDGLTDQQFREIRFDIALGQK